MTFEPSQPGFESRDWLQAMSKAHMPEHSALRWISGAAPSAECVPQASRIYWNLQDIIPVCLICHSRRFCALFTVTSLR